MCLFLLLLCRGGFEHALCLWWSHICFSDYVTLHITHCYHFILSESAVPNFCVCWLVCQTKCSHHYAALCGQFCTILDISIQKLLEKASWNDAEEINQWPPPQWVYAPDRFRLRKTLWWKKSYTWCTVRFCSGSLDSSMSWSCAHSG